MLAAILEGAQNSFRPVLMAATTNLLGLVPVMLAVGIGADVMRRITSPMFGGLISLTLLTLIVIPIIYRSYATYNFRKEVSNPSSPS